MDVCCLLLCGTTYGQKWIQKAAILIKINFRWFPNFPPSFPIFLTQNLKKWEIERRKYWEINFNIQIGSKSSEWVPGTHDPGPKWWDPSTKTQTLRFGMFGSQVLGATVPGPKCRDPDTGTQVPGCKYGDECPCVDEVNCRYIGA